jgi:hypothetical protein
MSVDAVLLLARATWQYSPFWGYQRAWRAIRDGRYQIITGRRDAQVYLVRMWLVEEPPLQEHVRAGDGAAFESGSQVLLHYFARGDDDAALHDHPWNFTTTILQGGYYEHLPPFDWHPSDGGGPPWDQMRVLRRAGETIHRKATDLHCVGSIIPGTMTLVSTGPRIRPWGFFPPGKPWQLWTDFLAQAHA